MQRSIALLIRKQHASSTPSLRCFSSSTFANTRASIRRKRRLREQQQDHAFVSDAYRNANKNELFVDAGVREYFSKCLNSISNFEQLCDALRTPPSLSTIRFNNSRLNIDEACSIMNKHMEQHYDTAVGNANLRLRCEPFHGILPDAIQFDLCSAQATAEPTTRIMQRNSLQRKQKFVVVDKYCGEAVLRGANVFAPGILGVSALTKGDQWSGDEDIAVLCDPTNALRKGSKIATIDDITATSTADGSNSAHNSDSTSTSPSSPGSLPPLSSIYDKYIHVANGRIRMDHQQIFHTQRHGLAVQITECLFPTTPSLPLLLQQQGEQDSTSLDSAEMRGGFFLQNLPSMCAAHVLDPQPGERVLDMCASPGGKTTHIAQLMHDQGEVIALDRSYAKVAHIEELKARLGLSCIRARKMDAARAIESGLRPESFDRILLDPPCSGLGLRPNLRHDCTMDMLVKCAHFQRSLLRQAIALLKPGGTLVYSTCTISPMENEENVLYALGFSARHSTGGGLELVDLSSSHPLLKQRYASDGLLLSRVLPHSRAYSSMDRALIDPAPLEERIAASVMRFDPVKNPESIGFFIAKFKKKQRINK